MTIGGESAGAMSVTTLMAMPKAAGLFHRAVAQSGAGHHALSAATATRVAGYLAEKLGVEATHEALARSPSTGSSPPSPPSPARPRPTPTRSGGARSSTT